MSARRRRRVYLTGFMGAGKSVVGRELAAQLGWDFEDLDATVERMGSATIPELFAARGEGGFRRLERRALKATLERARLVVATGGGALVSRRARELVRGRGRVVWLDVPFERLAARLAAGGDGRPLYRGPAETRALYDARRPAYADCDHAVRLTGDESPATAAATILNLLGEARCAT